MPNRKYQPGCPCCGGTPCGGSPATYNLTITTCGYPRPGVVVTAVGPGGTIAATSDGSGVASLSLPAGGSYAISAAPPSGRFVTTSGGTITVVCGGTSGATLGMTVAAGHHCISGSWEPVPNTLYYSDACTSSVSDTQASGNSWTFFSACPTNPSDSLTLIASWIASSPSSGHWQIQGFIFSTLPLGTFICAESNHDPADPVNVTYTAITSGTDPAIYFPSPWNMQLSE